MRRRGALPAALPLLLLVLSWHVRPVCSTDNPLARMWAKVAQRVPPAPSPAAHGTGAGADLTAGGTATGSAAADLGAGGTTEGAGGVLREDDAAGGLAAPPPVSHEDAIAFLDAFVARLDARMVAAGTPLPVAADLQSVISEVTANVDAATAAAANVAEETSDEEEDEDEGEGEEEEAETSGDAGGS